MVVKSSKISVYPRFERTNVLHDANAFTACVTRLLLLPYPAALAPGTYCSSPSSPTPPPLKLCNSMFLFCRARRCVIINICSVPEPRASTLSPSASTLGPAASLRLTLGQTGERRRSHNNHIYNNNNTYYNNII